MNGAFDRQAAEKVLRQWNGWIGTANEADTLDALAACVTPDRRIAAISALCKQGEAYGYVRIDAIRDVLNGGS